MTENNGKVSENTFLRRYFQDFSWVAAGMGAAMVVDFLYYILAGRLMTPTDFGYFGVMISLYYILLRSPFRVIEMASKKIQADGRDSLRMMGFTSLLIGISLFLIFLIFSGPISSLLDVPLATVRVFSFAFPVGYFLAVLVGKIQGDQDYRRYGIYEFLSSVLAFSALFLVYLGFGSTGAVAMFVLEILAGFVFLLKYENIDLGFLRWREAATEKRLLIDSFIYVMAVHAAFSLDLLAVNYFFTSEATGLYNTVSVLGKGLFFGAVAVNRTVFPKFVLEKSDRMRNLKLSQMLLGAGGIFAVLFFLSIGDSFIAYTFGESYLQAASFAPHYMVMVSVISASALLANYCLSQSLRQIRYMAIMPVVQVVLIALFHQSVFQIIYATLTAATLTSLLLVYGIIKSEAELR